MRNGHLSRALESHNKYTANLAAVNAENKRIVFEALARAGIATVLVDFDGEGDGGQVQSPTAYTADDQLCDLPNATITIRFATWGSDTITDNSVPLAEAIQDLCYGYLEHEHGGWENNDGAFGEFSFHVPDQRVELAFNARFTDSTHYTHTF